MKPNWKLFKNILTRCSRSHNPTTEQGSKGKPGTDGSQRGHKKTRGKRKRGHDKWNKGESSGWQREIWCWDVQGLIWEARDPWRNCRLLQFIHDFFFFSFWEHLKIQWLLSLKGEFLEVSKARLEGTTWDGRGGIYEIYEMRFMVQNHSGNPWFYFFFPWRTGKKSRFLWRAGKDHGITAMQITDPFGLQAKDILDEHIVQPQKCWCDSTWKTELGSDIQIPKVWGKTSRFPPQQRLRLENWEFFHWEADLYKHSKG